MKQLLLLLLLIGARLPAASDGSYVPEPPQAPATPLTPQDWRLMDYNALYSVLQQYRDELEGLKAENEKVKREAALLQETADALARRIDNMRPLDGLKFHGRLVSYGDDLLLLGPGAQAPRVRGRYRIMVQRAELGLVYQRGFVSALVRQDMQYVFGNHYDVSTVINTGLQNQAVPTAFSIGIRRMYIDFDLPLRFRVGDFEERLTPLVFWRNEDPDPETPAIFADRRQRLRDDRDLVDDHRYRQRGVHLGWGSQVGDPGAGFTLMGSQLAQNSISGVDPFTQLLLQGQYNGRDHWTYATSAVGSPHLFGVYDTFIGAGTLHWASEASLFDLSVQGSVIGDTPDGQTATRVYGTGAHVDPKRVGQPYDGFLNTVYGAAITVSPSAKFHAGAEFAASSLRAPGVSALWLSKDHGPDGSLRDSAIFAHAEGDLAWLGYEARYALTGKNYVSGGAQGRTWDSSIGALGPFETENSYFDAASQGYGAIRMPQAPVSAYTGALLPPVLWYEDNLGAVKATLVRLPFDPAVNSLDPYGLATPNRNRYGGTLKVNLFDGGLRLRGDVDQATEVDNPVAKLSILRYGAGGAAKWHTLSANGYYRVQSLGDGGWVVLNSIQTQAGLEWAAWEGGALQSGFRHLDFNGVLPYSDPTPFATPDTNLLPIGRQAMSRSYDQWAVGLVHHFREDLTLWANYGVTLMTNPLAGKTASAADGRPNFSVEQGYARLTLDF